jgi:hypothetical protein
VSISYAYWSQNAHNLILLSPYYGYFILQRIGYAFLTRLLFITFQSKGNLADGVTRRMFGCQVEIGASNFQFSPLQDQILYAGLALFRLIFTSGTRRLVVLVGSYHTLRGNWCLQFQDKNRGEKKLGGACQATWHRTPKGVSLCSRRCQTLYSRKLLFLYQLIRPYRRDDERQGQIVSAHALKPYGGV